MLSISSGSLLQCCFPTLTVCNGIEETTFQQYSIAEYNFITLISYIFLFYYFANFYFATNFIWNPVLVKNIITFFIPVKRLISSSRRQFGKLHLLHGHHTDLSMDIGPVQHGDLLLPQEIPHTPAREQGQLQEGLVVCPIGSQRGNARLHRFKNSVISPSSCAPSEKKRRAVTPYR
ncbi:hypothetical protein GWK47_050445 [Chionoecetes opilio]|uniref:Uncharacterized protein n=1 Tax=Chionoecetes opilio TaxID=41210 RepID=A0A8J5CTP5_CHIOP|nr:hypothetical protein GWK47_050445 [Chionoecetes opilio]